MASYFGNTSKKSWSNFSVVAETLNSVHITLRWPRSQTIWYSNQFFLSYVLKYDRKTFNKYILTKFWLDNFGYFEYFPSSAHSAGGGPKGGLVLDYQKSCVISILRVLIVGISKMISIFTLGYPKPPKGRPQGGGLGGARGRFSPILTLNENKYHFWNPHYWKLQNWYNTWFLVV